MAIIIDSEIAIDNQILDNTENLLGKTFPEEYRAFMLRNNGGRPEPDGFGIFWDSNALQEDWRSSCVDWFLSIYDETYSNLVKYNNITFYARIPADTIAIAHDPGGNLILLGVGEKNNGKIYFWVKDHEVEDGDTPGYDNVGFLANSLTEFLDKLYSY